MTRHEMQLDGQTLLKDIRRLRVSYEVYPDLTLQVEDASGMWFEIALHIEVEEYRPADHLKSREEFSVLMGVAERLIQRVKSHAPYRLEMPGSYHTLHSPAPGRPALPSLARTISLVFSDIGRPYTLHEEPGILARLRAELALLGIRRLDRGSPDGGQ